MSQENARGDMQVPATVDPKKPYVFLDYGGLIVNYEFTSTTLNRAHNIALSLLNADRKHFTLNDVEKAHSDAIRNYLEYRKTGKELSMKSIMTNFLTGLQMNHEYILPNDELPSAEDLVEIYRLNDHNVEPMPKTLESIIPLSKLAYLGIVSNLPHDSIKDELQRLGLWGIFRPIVISYEVGYRKPHPAIYQEALKRANISHPSQSIFFSHEQIEVDGAKAAGMQAHLAQNLAEVLNKMQTSYK